MSEENDRLRNELEAAQRFSWTSERPTVPGWYWVLGPLGKHPAVSHIRYYDLPLKHWIGYWFIGPLIPPPIPDAELQARGVAWPGERGVSPAPTSEQGQGGIIDITG